LPKNGGEKMKPRDYAAVFLFALPSFALGADPERMGLDTCAATSTGQAIAVAERLGRNDQDVVKIGEVIFIVESDMNVQEAIAGFPTKPPYRRTGPFCKALCSEHAVEGCGVLLACVDWAVSDFTKGAPLCSTTWFLVGRRLQGACGC
jgi:hypothetical protein